jgi:hypothetical protein
MIISGHYRSAPLQINKELTTENKNFGKGQFEIGRIKNK